MNPSIAAAVYTAAAICAARGSLVGLKPTKAVTSGLIAWLATALAIFFVQEPGLVMVSAAVIFALLAPADRTERVGFFLIVVPCLPIYLMSAIPFPGINYLLLITPYKVCSLVILVPILFYKDGNDARAYALQMTAKAQGDATAFEKVYAEYRAAPDVPRRRMYYETMERILSRGRRRGPALLDRSVPDVSRALFRNLP